MTKFFFKTDSFGLIYRLAICTKIVYVDQMSNLTQDLNVFDKVVIKAMNINKAINLIEANLELESDISKYFIKILKLESVFN